MITKSLQAHVVRGTGLINDLSPIQITTWYACIIRHLVDVHESRLPRPNK